MFKGEYTLNVVFAIINPRYFSIYVSLQTYIDHFKFIWVSSKTMARHLGFVFDHPKPAKCLWEGLDFAAFRPCGGYLGQPRSLTCQSTAEGARILGLRIKDVAWQLDSDRMPGDLMFWIGNEPW